jgi:hypothetical protein
MSGAKAAKRNGNPILNGTVETVVKSARSARIEDRARRGPAGIVGHLAGHEDNLHRTYRPDQSYRSY